MNKTQACIGIPTYNPNLEKLKITIDSVLNQTHKNIHIIISENSPKNDLVKEFVLSLKKKNINIDYYDQKKFLPQVENWDFCIMSSKSQYTMILGDDDTISENYISSSIQILEKDKNLWGVGCKWKHILRDGRINIDPAFYYEDEDKFIRIKNFLFNEEDTYVNALMRTEMVQRFGFKKSISYYWWPNKSAIQQLFTQFLFTCTLHGKGTFNEDAIYIHQDPRPRGFKADFSEKDNKTIENKPRMEFVDFFLVSLKGYLRHFNLWFNYLKITMKYDLKSFPIYFYYILITITYLQYRYSRKILRKLKNLIIKKENLY